MRRLPFPEGKRFAFTIFDDTDGATVANVKPVYDLLLQLGIMATKSVWVFGTNATQSMWHHSQTLTDDAYLSFIRWLSKHGFEIAFHNASASSSVREVTLSAIERFKELLGCYPKVHANHLSNRENLYWGRDRLDLPLLKFFMGFKRKSSAFVGHDPHSPYFWGDICQKYITYVRSFVFREINLMRINPTLPYRDPNRPLVRYWFSSSEGGKVSSFNQLISLKSQDRLEDEGAFVSCTPTLPMALLRMEKLTR